MKKRSSQKKAENSVNNSDWYKEQCKDILYRRKLELRIEGEEVFLLSDGKEELLLNVLKQKKIWLEIWRKLTDA